MKPARKSNWWPAISASAGAWRRVWLKRDVIRIPNTPSMRLERPSVWPRSTQTDLRTKKCAPVLTGGWEIRRFRVGGDQVVIPAAIARPIDKGLAGAGTVESVAQFSSCVNDSI